MASLLATSTSSATATTTTTAATTTLHRLLANREYDIEFHGYLSNHAKHAVIALERLGAPATRIQDYWDGYTAVTPYGLSLHRVSDKGPQQQNADDPLTTRDEWNRVRGQKQQFWNMCHYLQRELEQTFDGNVTKLVQSYAPDLLSGMAGALTHGIIHLGWALDAYQNDTTNHHHKDTPNKNPCWMVIEGLAYLNFVHLSVHPEQFQHQAVDETSALETWRRIARTWHENDLQHTWIAAAMAKYDEASGFHTELIPAGFQWQLSKVLEQPHDVMRQLPTWLDTMDISASVEELYKMATILYLVTRDSQDGHGNFLVLHLISSLWGLEQVLRVIQDDDIARQALKCYHAMMIGLLATSSGGIPSLDALDAIAVDQNILTAVDTAGEAQKVLEETAWADIIEKATYHEEEEHNIKLVYVTRALWRRYQYWTGFRLAAQAFTLTPNVAGGGTLSSTAFKA